MLLWLIPAGVLALLLWKKQHEDDAPADDSGGAPPEDETPVPPAFLAQAQGQHATSAEGLFAPEPVPVNVPAAKVAFAPSAASVLRSAAVAKAPAKPKLNAAAIAHKVATRPITRLK